MIPPLPDEAEVLKRCRTGDTEAFGRLASHYQDVIYNLVYRMIGHREDARDVAQDVFIKAFRGIRSFERRSSFATWLYSIAVNQAISQRRRRGAKSRGNPIQLSRLDGPDGETSYVPPGDAPEPDRRMRSAETLRQIEAAIAELDDDHRAIVLLRDIEDLDYKSISETLGCSRGTVKSRLHRARLELRRKLKPLVTD
jgi:RNA polymerase sigma-70 factor (ECF subfamily)